MGGQSSDHLFPNAARARNYGAAPAAAEEPAPDDGTAAGPERQHRGSGLRADQRDASSGSTASGVPQVANGAVRALRPPRVEARALPAPLTVPQDARRPPVPAPAPPRPPVSQVPPAPPRVEPVVARIRVVTPRMGAAVEGAAAPAQWGGRGRLNRLSGGLVTLRPAAEELRYREAQLRVLRPFRSSQLVLVANPKGGAGKTPTTVGVAATLGHHRGGYVLAWDNNETRGTLGERVEPGPGTDASVVDLLGQIDGFLSSTASVGQLGGFVRPQSAHFDVLASDETPGRQQMIDGPGFLRLHQALARWYRIVVTDTGNNVRAPNWWASVRAAHCLVVPTTVQADSANAGLWMLDHLHAVGARVLVQHAIAVVTCADPRVDRRLLAEIVETYGQVVRQVVVIPFDPAIASGTPITYRYLAARTRRAYLATSVAVIDSLAAMESAVQQVHGGGAQ
jgi:MinD-like ATPase involved in chromosome partitioning or flagellar assembly